MIEDMKIFHKTYEFIYIRGILKMLCKSQAQKLGVLMIGLLLILSMNFISAELNYTTGESIYTGINSPNNALDGILSYPHIFNKSLTSEEIINWSTYTGELLIASGEDLVLPVNRFLQYQAKLQTNDTKYTPILWEVNAIYGDVFKVKLYEASKIIFGGNSKLVIKN